MGSKGGTHFVNLPLELREHKSYIRNNVTPQLSCQAKYHVPGRCKSNGWDEEGRHRNGTNTKGPLDMEGLDSRSIASINAYTVAALNAVCDSSAHLL